MTARMRTLTGLVTLVLLVAVFVWVRGAGAGEHHGEASDEHRASGESGLAHMAEGDLPPEAREVLDLIDAGGPFRYDKDGSVFGNFEGLLPDEDRGYYHEYTVDTPGSDDRGARRIVTGDRSEYYWTEDHYESFALIER